MSKAEQYIPALPGCEDPIETEHGKLLRAVLEDPDDDTVRLAFADWLDEHPERPCPHCGGGRPGSWAYATDDELRCATCGRRGVSGSGLVDDGCRRARAEFIRLQVKIANFPPKPFHHHDQCKPSKPDVRCGLCEWQLVNGAEHKVLYGRENELLLKWWTDWLGESLPRLGWHLGNYDTKLDRHSAPAAWFRRGFVEEVRVMSTVFCKVRDGAQYTIGCAEELFSEHPVTRVLLHDREPDSSSFNDVGAELWYMAGQNRRAAMELTDVADSPSMIPRDVFELLGPSAKTEYPGYEWVTYGNNADGALNKACVKYGRKLVGLKELKL